MTRKFRVFLNIHQQPTLRVLGHLSCTLKAPGLVHQMGWSSKHVRQSWCRRWLHFGVVRFHFVIVVLIIVIVVAIIIVTGVHSIVIVVAFLGFSSIGRRRRCHSRIHRVPSATRRGSKCRTGQLFFHHFLHHAHGRVHLRTINHARGSTSHHHSSATTHHAGSFVHQSHGSRGVGRSNVVFKPAVAAAGHSSSARGGSTTASSSLVLHIETHGSFQIPTAHFNVIVGRGSVGTSRHG
mmetsp:Transcript_1259/g.3548  ORF Transcript_1259/g.3548 Transcript_1259/m.3548 type:complete len:237 (+) Transcript_1259:2832-3542(+)